MAVDFLRNGHHGLMRAWQDSPGSPAPFPVVWFRVGDRTPFLPFAHAYTSAIWDAPEEYTDIGEQNLYDEWQNEIKHPYYLGFPPAPYLAKNYCGPLDAWQQGGVWGTTPALTMLANGMSTCCAMPSQIAVGGEKEGGTAVQATTAPPHWFGGQREGGRWVRAVTWYGGEREGSYRVPIVTWYYGEREGGDWNRLGRGLGGEREGKAWPAAPVPWQPTSGGEREGKAWPAGQAVGQAAAGGEREGKAWPAGPVPWQPTAGGEREGNTWPAGLAPAGSGAGGEREGNAWSGLVLPPANLLTIVDVNPGGGPTSRDVFYGGTTAGDLVYIAIAISTTIPTAIAAPAGWTLDWTASFSANFYMVGMWKIVASGDPGVMSFNADITDSVGVVYAILSGTSTWDVGTPGVTTGTAPQDGGIACTQGNQLALYFLCCDAGGTAQPGAVAPWIAQVWLSSAGPQPIGAWLATYLPYGAQGPWVFTSLVTADWIAIVVAFKVP